MDDEKISADYLDRLNQQQRAAVAYCDGPQLVIAGAGSGKTRVLTYKIVHLLASGIEPWRILALTFTNKAAREMRERIESLVGFPTASKLWMGTFHSVFARILRANAERLGYKGSFTIYDAADSKSLVKMLIKENGLDEKVYKPSAVLSAISSAKNSLISPEKYATLKDVTDADRQAGRPLIQDLYRAYRDRCMAAGAMDFDDLLYYTNVLLRDNPDVLERYSEHFRYVLVDEYQDTNFAQHVIVTQLCKSHGHLCVVGDDAQSIYSFRGANIRNILNLERTFTGLRTFKLERNYRSTQNIINAANSLIEKNTEQIHKQVFSENPPGQRVEVIQSYNDYEESYTVANRIRRRKMSTADSYEEFAVLYRTNAQSRRLEEALRARNIPYRIYGGLSFYQRKEIKDAVAYFRLTVNQADDEALRRIINFPARGIGDTTLGKLTRCAIDSGVSIMEVIADPAAHRLELGAAALKKLQAFRELIGEFSAMNARGLDAGELAEAIVRRTGLLTMLVTERTPESISKQENLTELLNAAREFAEQQVEAGQTDTSLSAFLSQVSLATDQDSDDGSDERVTLMTVHAAKGLEFNNVIIVGVEDDRFPSAMAAGSLSEIEEERRLLYVAITRARNHCTLSYATSGVRNGQPAVCAPSRFLRDIDPRYLKIDPGVEIGAARPAFAPASRPASSATPSWRRAYAPKPAAAPAQRATATPAPAAAAGASGTHTPQELSVGMKIVHNRFGAGTIAAIITAEGTDPRIEVTFDQLGTKTLLLKYAQFTIAG